MSQRLSCSPERKSPEKISGIKRVAATPQPKHIKFNEKLSYEPEHKIPFHTAKKDHKVKQYWM